MNVVLAGAVAACFFGGCATDSLTVIDHPETVEPGATYQAQLINSLALFSDGSELSEAINRDSLYIALGVPEGWSVGAIGYYVASHIKFNNFPTSPSDSSAVDTAFIETLKDSLAAFAARQQALAQNDNLAQYLFGNTIPANYSNAEDLDGSTVAQWSGFSAHIGLEFPEGTKMDTAFAIPDSVKDQMDPGGIMGLDSAGISVVPVFIFASLTATTQAGADTVYFYSKTGDFPQFPGESSGGMTSLPDYGSLAMQKVLVGESAVRTNVAAGKRSLASVRQRPDGSYAIQIDYADRPAQARILSPTGATVRTLNLAPSGGIWNGLDNSGHIVPAGAYIVAITSGERAFSRQIQHYR